MNVDSRKGLKLSLAQKLSRLAVRLRDPEWRRYGGTLLAGKVLGVGLVLVIMAVVSAACSLLTCTRKRPRLKSKRPTSSTR